MINSKRIWALCALFALPATSIAFAAEPPGAPKGKQEQTREASSKKEAKGVDPEAARLLKEMTDYLGGLPRFAVESASVDEVVTKSGQKIQLIAESRVTVERPNHLRSERAGREPEAASFMYDGTTMSLLCPASNTFGTVPAPPTIDATIDKLRKDYGADAPGADLLYSRPYEVLMEQVKEGQVIGKETILGMSTNHLAFQGEDVDWQIWIKEGPEPLPLRYVITSKKVQSQPQFTVQMTHWDPRAKIDDGSFTFRAPAGAKKVDNLPTSCRAK